MMILRHLMGQMWENGTGVNGASWASWAYCMIHSARVAILHKPYIPGNHTENTLTSYSSHMSLAQ